jgi:hypothetical protein
MPKPENIVKHRFKKGQSGNPDGRPKKNYSDVISELRAKGYKPPCKSEYFDMIGMLLVMNEEDLQDFAKDASKPYWIRSIAIDLNNKNMRQKITSDHRDWLFGKASQKMEVENKGSVIIITEQEKNV